MRALLRDSAFVCCKNLDGTTSKGYKLNEILQSPEAEKLAATIHFMLTALEIEFEFFKNI